MEVNFRPLPPSAATRRVGPNHVPSSDEGQNFLEVIESLTSAENNPQANEQAGGNKEQAKRQQQGEEIAPPGEETGEPTDTQNTPSDQQQPGEKKLGTHFDILA